MGGIESQIERVLTDIQRLVGDKTYNQLQDVLQEMEVALQEATSTMDEIGSTVEENRVAVEMTIRNIREMSADLKKPLGTIVSSLDRNTEEFGSLITHLESASQSLDLVLEAIEEGRGSMGKMVLQESLYNRIHNALYEFELLVRDIRENPNKYLKVEVF